jgi:hypothetical protein
MTRYRQYAIQKQYNNSENKYKCFHDIKSFQNARRPLNKIVLQLLSGPVKRLLQFTLNFQKENVVLGQTVDILLADTLQTPDICIVTKITKLNPHCDVKFYFGSR